MMTWNNSSAVYLEVCNHLQGIIGEQAYLGTPSISQINCKILNMILKMVIHFPHFFTYSGGQGGPKIHCSNSLLVIDGGYNYYYKMPTNPN